MVYKQHISLILKELEVKLSTKFGDFEVVAFIQVTTGDTHLAIKKGEWKSAADRSTFHTEFMSEKFLKLFLVIPVSFLFIFELFRKLFQ